jgi:CubicO group peptidase (beta-lactamase class C family)
MMRSFVTAGLIVSLLLLPPGGRRAAAGAGRDAPAAELERLIRRLMDEGDVPGLSVALIRGAKVYWHRAFGLKNAETREPLDDATVFEAASLGKPVIAYAVLKLADAGGLDLDKPLSSYLPAPYLQGDERVKLITARMVLSHRTGFQNEVTPGNPLKLYFTPGERFSYSGEGFVYLQKVVEEVTGERLDAFTKRTVFDPLGMADSSYVWRDGYERSKASGHDAAGAVGRMRRPTVASPSSLHTTVLDFAKFVVAVMNGTGLRKETAREMLRTQARVEEGCHTCVGRGAGRLSETLSWGLGWGLERTKAGGAFWHWGENNGEFQNFVMAYPGMNTGVVIFTNSGNGISVMPEIVSRALGGGPHPAFAWMGYEAYDSPARLLLRDILRRGDAAVRQYREARGKSPRALSEARLNQLAYTLLARKRVAEAVELFRLNVEDFPDSWNACDSLGEAYMVRGDKELAIKYYRRSLELNPANANAAEMIKKLSGH